ncbi:MAG TPA: D-aminoacyl-tRNA deacylase [Candidatus Nanoarchaeia archaeon]|nr:D-aminoacyl-tRNA deacylase [Candidatus Nanoarchaeia archaeon]
MHVAILITTPDYAGLNIKQCLLESAMWRETDDRFEQWSVFELVADPQVRIYTTATKCINCEHFDQRIAADIFLVPTTHRSAAGVQSFTVHSIGNWGSADLGGGPKTLGISPAVLQREALFKIRELAEGMPYQVTLEATHHGPELSKPCLFLEIGSGEESWKNADAGRVIAQTVLHLLPFATGEKIPKGISVVGIGGPHYAPNFLKVMERSDYAVGHIAPKHQLSYFDAEMLRQAREKTLPRAEFALLDWKGLGEHKQRVVALLEEQKVPWKKI